MRGTPAASAWQAFRCRAALREGTHTQPMMLRATEKMNNIRVADAYLPILRKTTVAIELLQAARPNRQILTGYPAEKHCNACEGDDEPVGRRSRHVRPSYCCGRAMRTRMNDATGLSAGPAGERGEDAPHAKPWCRREASLRNTEHKMPTGSGQTWKMVIVSLRASYRREPQKMRI